MSRALARAAAAGGRADHTVHRSLRSTRATRPDTWSARRRMVMGDDVGDVAQPPAGRCELHREAALLAADAVARVEAACGQERAATHDRRAGDEPEHLVPQRAAPHRHAGRVEALLLSHEDPAPRRPRAAAARRGPTPRGRARPAPTRSRRRGRPRSGVASRSTPTLRAAAPRARGSATTSTCGNRSAIAPAVPSHDASSTTTTARPLGQRDDACQRGQHAVASVACRDDDADARARSPSAAPTRPARAAESEC